MYAEIGADIFSTPMCRIQGGVQIRGGGPHFGSDKMRGGVPNTRGGGAPKFDQPVFSKNVRKCITKYTVKGIVGICSQLPVSILNN